MKKLSINELFEAFNHSSLCLNRLGGVALLEEKYYTDKCSYNFTVTDKGDTLLVKYFTCDSTKAKETIRFVESFGEPLFVESEWLEQELVVTDASGKRVCADLACYKIDFERTLQEVVNHVSATNQCDSKNEATVKSFFRLLKWLIDASVAVDPLSLSTLVVDRQGNVKINLADHVVVRRDDASGNFTRCLVALTKEVLYAMVGAEKRNSPEALALCFGEAAAQRIASAMSKQDLVAIADEVLQRDLKQGATGIVSPSLVRTNCFNSEKYTVEEDSRAENRVVVVDNETQLRGYASFCGDLVIDCLYSEATLFCENCAVVVRDEMAGVINRAGETVVDFSWDWIEWDCRDNVFRLNRGTTWRVMHRYADSVAEPAFDFIAAFDNGRAIASRNGKEGIIDAYGNELVPFVYDSITDLGKDRYALVRENDKQILYF